MEIDEQFVYGFIVALIIVSCVLFTQYGNHFNFLKKGSLMILPSFGEALNWKTMVILSCFFLIFFRNLKTSSLFFRCVLTLLFIGLAWGVSDLFWIVKAVFIGNYLFGSSILTFPSVNDILVGVSRDLLFVSPIVFLYPFLKFSKIVLVSVFVFVGYWSFLLYPVYLNWVVQTTLGSRALFSNPLFHNFIYHFVGFLPFVVAFKEWRCVSWRKFLLF